MKGKAARRQHNHHVVVQEVCKIARFVWSILDVNVLFCLGLFGFMCANRDIWRISE